MPHALENWFDWLTKAHERTLTLNTLTDPDPVVFANTQSPKDLLPTQQTQRNLAQFLSNEFGVAPPDEAFSTTTFRSFVDVTVPDRDSDVRNVFFLVAVRQDPSIGALTQPQFGRKKTTDMFPTPASRDDLFDTLNSFTPDAFFPDDAANRLRMNTLLAGAGTVDAAVKKALN